MTNFTIAGILVNRFGFTTVPADNGASDLEIVFSNRRSVPDLKKTSTFEHSLAIKFRKFANKAFGIDLALEDLRPL